MKKTLLIALLGLLELTTPFISHAATSADADEISRGAYLARAGDCIACHTAKGSDKLFAGGLPMATPIGTIYSTNITPDPTTGIGKWTFAEFDNAVRKGYSPNGSLYPAMPFPSYARLNEVDMRALYAYFMSGRVKAVDEPNRDSTIPWPLSMRWPLTIWRWLFAPKAVSFDASAYPNAQMARGAYLVQGLGHCGACHTPRSLTMAEKALTDADGLDYLSGGAPIDGYVAKSLRQDGLARWSAADIVTFLKTGRTNNTAVFGGMADVVQHSMQYMSDDDLKAIAGYLKSLPPKHPHMPDYVYNNHAGDALRNGDASARGALLFINNCAACHRTDGHGYTAVFPALAGNSVVETSDPTSLINIVLQGSTLDSTHAAPSTFTMPGFSKRLTDQQVADVVSFIRLSWGNNASGITAGDVAAQRILIPRPVPKSSATVSK